MFDATSDINDLNVGYLKRSLTLGRKLAKRLGVSVYWDKHLPHGLDHRWDLVRMTQQDRFNVVFDIGANVGCETLRYAPLADQVYAFEPVADTYRELCDAVYGLPNVQCIHMALGAEPDQVEIEIAARSGLNSLVGGTPVDAGPRSPSSDSQTEIVTVDTVDRFCERHEIATIDIAKIDVEGFEPQVLEGAAGMLQERAIRFLYIETVFREDEMHTSFRQLDDILGPYGYSLHALYDYAHFGRPGAIGYCNALFV